MNKLIIQKKPRGGDFETLFNYNPVPTCQLETVCLASSNFAD